MDSKYESIINLKYEGVKNHKRMDRAKRASIFSPFAPIKINDDIKENKEDIEIDDK